MNFKDLLNRPLPSQSFKESADDLDDFLESDNMMDDSELEESFDGEDDFGMDAEEGCASKAEGCCSKKEGCMSKSEGCGSRTEGCGSKAEGCGSRSEGCGYRSEESDEDDDDEFLDDLDDELDNDGDYDYGDDEDDEEDDECEGDECDELEEKPAAPLTGEADIQADNMMAMAATPMLIRDELSAEESVAFFNSSEAEIAVAEGFLTESDIDDVFDDDVFEEGVFANPNKPFKMTKAARFKQLYELSLQIEARQHKDPKYKTLQKAYAIERKIKKDWRKKYHALAMKRAKTYLKKLMTSKSPILNSIGKKLGFKK